MRFFAVLIGLSVAAAVLPAGAQTGARPGGERPSADRPGADKTPPKEQPAVRRPSTIEDLFERLAAAKDEDEAKGIATLIERRWSRSGSDTADLLMSRAAEAAKAKDFALAIELLDRILTLEPNWAEAWHRRANVFHMMDDTVSAMADLRQALSKEPRHFEAWTGLGHIFRSSEDKRSALEAYRRALKLHPQQPNIRKLIERLRPEVDGQDL
jgi:Tfp pilus assembly protein PilF